MKRLTFKGSEVATATEHAPFVLDDGRAFHSAGRRVLVGRTYQPLYYGFPSKSVQMFRDSRGEPVYFTVEIIFTGKRDAKGLLMEELPYGVSVGRWEDTPVSLLEGLLG